MRTKPRLVATTTTSAPEPALKERKPSRLNGILNRRKPGTLTTIPAKTEEQSDVVEDANNNAHEDDSQHKGVVVQVSRIDQFKKA